MPPDVRDITFAVPPADAEGRARIRSARNRSHGCRIRMAGARGSQVPPAENAGKRERISSQRSSVGDQVQRRDLMNSTRRNRSAVQSSSIATCRTVSKPSFFSTAQPVSRLNSQVYLREVPFG